MTNEQLGAARAVQNAFPRLSVRPSTRGGVSTLTPCRISDPTACGSAVTVPHGMSADELRRQLTVACRALDAS